MLRTPHWLAGLLASLLLSSVSHAQPAGAGAPGGAGSANRTATRVAAHEQQLATIRQALVEATLQAPTQVVSTAWIDQTGALREDTQFNSRAEVRGIRLQSIGQDADGQPLPQVTADVLPWSWREDAQASQNCPAAARAWRVPLAVVPVLSPGLTGAQLSAGQALLRSVERQAHALLQQGRRWLPREPSMSQRSSYLQALTAPIPEETDWRLEIQLLPDTPARPGNMLSQPTLGSTPAGLWRSTPGQWTLRLSLHNASAHATQSVRWEQDYRMAVDLEQLLQNPAAWRAPIEAELIRRIAPWLQGLEQRLRCEPTPWRVRHAAGALTLMAGADSGLRAGDRVLVMQPGWVPGRMLDPRVADHLALAEVVHSTSRHTEIRQLAGPPLPSGHEWVALPL